MVKVIKKQAAAGGEKEEQTQKILTKFNKQEEEEMSANLARQSGLMYIDLNIYPLSGTDITAIPEGESQKYGIGVFQKLGKKVRIAIVDPNDDKTKEYIKKLQAENGWEITLYVVSHSSMERVWNKYKETPFIESLDTMHMSLSGKDLEEFEKEFGDLLDLKKRIREIPTSEIINTIMAGGIKMKASDIHFEPQEKAVRLRYRIDGVLQDIGDFPHEVYKFLLSRVKMMGKMKLNIRDIAQDGHFSIKLENGKFDVRVNIIPGNFGESVVMRLLNQADVMLNVEDLGLRGLAYEQIQKQMAKTNGMILTTGPTGSGKTTTLYAFINKLNTPDVKIITIEDPVEYEIKGISQTQVAKDKGYTFGAGLRAIVRQDPDVILVGEIRDEETADIAINAALTGHFVLSTLHTNNAAASIPRLIEVGVKPNLIAPAINAFIAQRLVRRLCPDCREKYVPAKETIDSLKKILAIISPKAKVEIPKNIEFLYRAKGCPKCHNLGYRGRIGIFEVLTMNETIEKLVSDMAGENEIIKAALEEGMITMAQDGILKAVEGLTSVEEVWRVTGQTEFLENIYEKLMEQSLSRAIDISEKDLEEVFKNSSSFDNLSKFISKANQKEMLKYVFAGALLLEAGDIHIEPEEKDVKVRFRIDGILQTVAVIPLNEYPSFLGEIKMLSGMKTEVREGVKDSRFAIALEKPFKNIKEIKTDIRVSIILGGYGETVVMRLLNKSAVALDIENLGIRKQNLDKILHEVEKPNGIFLNTGPTGSGKTTTLYSLLRVLNKPEVKIISVEDPIEYQMEGVLQTQVNDANGYSFPTALRALLRQNPDIMMIGEIRDEETAQIAVQAALTGHMVLSTLHTNDSAGSIQRLLNMGLRSDDLGIASNAFMAQRLVRKLCDCKEKVKPAPEEKEKIERILKSISEKSGIQIPKIDYIYKPKGCAKCNKVGYKGRTTISEVLVIDKELKEMISQNAMTTQIKDKAIGNGMITMSQDGILKVLEGETTMEEVERVVEE
jgi:type IV pilus assembly protein PilB